MTDAEYIDLKDTYIENLTKMVVDVGGLIPHIAIFAEHLDTTESDKPALVYIMIHQDYIESDDSKDKFVDEILPGVFKAVNQKFNVHSVAWASEAWVRTAPKDFDMEKEDWKAVPIKKEVVIISIEKENDTNTILYNITRDGKQVTEDGDIVDKITLELAEDLQGGVAKGGRFSGLFNKLKNS